MSEQDKKLKIALEDQMQEEYQVFLAKREELDFETSASYQKKMHRMIKKVNKDKNFSWARLLRRCQPILAAAVLLLVIIGVKEGLQYGNKGMESSNTINQNKNPDKYYSEGNAGAVDTKDESETKTPNTIQEISDAVSTSQVQTLTPVFGEDYVTIQLPKGENHQEVPTKLEDDTMAGEAISSEQAAGTFSEEALRAKFMTYKGTLIGEALWAIMEKTELAEELPVVLVAKSDEEKAYLSQWKNAWEDQWQFEYEDGTYILTRCYMRQILELAENKIFCYLVGDGQNLGESMEIGTISYYRCYGDGFFYSASDELSIRK